MKKKIFSIIIAATMALSLLAGCGTSSDVKAPSSVDADASADENVEVTDVAEGTASVSNDVSISETVLCDQDGVKITAIDIDSAFGQTDISVTIENNSAHNILVTARDVSVNDYMMEGAYLYSEVAAGKTANDQLTVYNTDLEEAGISTVATIAFCIAVSDQETWEDIFETDRITLNTSAAEGFEQAIDDSGDVLYDTNGIRVICKGLKDDSFWEGNLVLFVENNSDQSVSIYSENVSVNNYMTEDASFWVDLCPYTRAIDSMYLLDLSDLNLTGIDEITTIEFSFCIVDANTWEDVGSGGPITLNFN